MSGVHQWSVGLGGRDGFEARTLSTASISTASDTQPATVFYDADCLTGVAASNVARTVLNGGTVIPSPTARGTRMPRLSASRSASTMVGPTEPSPRTTVWSYVSSDLFASIFFFFIHLGVAQRSELIACRLGRAVQLRCSGVNPVTVVENNDRTRSGERRSTISPPPVDHSMSPPEHPAGTSAATTGTGCRRPTPETNGAPHSSMYPPASGDPQMSTADVPSAVSSSVAVLHSRLPSFAEGHRSECNAGNGLLGGCHHDRHPLHRFGRLRERVSSVLGTALVRTSRC